jgi:myosin heavy subunit
LKGEKFDYIQGSTDVDTINDKALYEDVLTSFRTMGFLEEEVDAILRVISSILLIGNLKTDDKSLT